jgi:Putative DNA-binding domain
LNLKDFQDRFQRAILERDDAILDDIPDGPRETKTNLLGIYRGAYALRLIEVIGNDHDVLRRYLGEPQFDGMARLYIASHPSRHPNARLFSNRIPEFLRATAPYSDQPVLAELAALERALNDAFDAADAPVVSMTDLAAVPAELWGGLSFVPHTCVTRLDVRSNAAAAWSALKADDQLPCATLAEEATHLIVWRHDMMSKFRSLIAEEAMMWDEMANGLRFGDLCEMLATYDDPPSAPARAAGFLKTWLDAGILTEVRLPE